MRLFIAGALTALVCVPLYVSVPRMKGSLSGVGTSLPKYMEVLIALSDTFVNYYYVMAPLVFVFFFVIALLVIPGKSKRNQR